MMDGNGWFRIQMCVVGVAILGLIAVTGVPAIQDSAVQAQESAEWCDNHDGELVQSNAMGPHGGLYCEFDNGTSVHMKNVNTGETA